jgi:ATP-dependent Clp protease ATP-binding subunit ClpC
MEDQTLLIESRHKVAVSYFALREAYHLADHYISEEAFPGKAIKLIEQAAVSAGPKTLINAEHVQQSIETSRGVKVQSVTKDESAKLLNLEDEIHQQMINQYRAVKVVSSALRRARAGVRDRNRPIGTFMFLGPTGVGKTQLAKALADVYFGGKDQIVRLDMNEYVNDTDVPRLLAAERENSSGVTFLNQIRQQPFSVVLLDEIEKAHPNVVNIFLQLLDEGTINDTDGRPASFKDAIIIATSNAGAERIRQYLDAGYEVEQFEDQFSNELIEMGIFKPEFLNRFDELVVFRSLKPAELMQVVTLMVNDVNKAIGSQKIKVELDNAAKMWLVERGNDPRLGARPMRRMVQRYVEDIIASKMLSGEAQSGAVITLTVQNFEEVAT